MISRRDVVMLDTMVILEAHRTRCWKSLCAAFALHSVDGCIQELVAKRPGSRRGFVEVDARAVREVMTIQAVSQRELAAIRLALMGLPDVDAGEEALLAHARGRSGAWLVSAPDNAMIKALRKLKFLDRYVTLEEMTRVGGCAPAEPLARHHTNAWFAEKRAQFILDELDPS